MSPDEHRMLKISSIYMPLAMVVSVIAGAIYFTNLVSTERSAIYSEIGGVRNEVSKLAETVERFIVSTDRRLAEGTNDRYTRHNYVIDCLKHQILNPEWTCLYGPKAGWVATIKKE